jgi:transcriptional regulator with XRE-family HTH domain
MAMCCQACKQQIARGYGYAFLMDAREILERKLRLLMAQSNGKYSDRKLLGAAAGVSARSVGYLLQKSGNPTLKTIQAVAGVFKLEAWELLIDDSSARERLMGRIFGSNQHWQPGDPERRHRERRAN